MFRWLLVCALLCGGSFYLVSLAVSRTPKNPPKPLESGVSGNPEPPVEGVPNVKRDPEPITVPELVIQGGEQGNGNRATVIHGARIVVRDKQDVSSEKEGIILFYATEPKNEAELKTLPQDKIIEYTFKYLAVEVAFDKDKPALKYPLAGKPQGEADYLVPYEILENGESNFFYLGENENRKVYTRWKQGMPIYPNRVKKLESVRKLRKLETTDRVDKGALLALINPKIALIELDTRVNKLKAAEAERGASEKTREEARTRWDTLAGLLRIKSASPEDVRGAELNYYRYLNEEISKAAAVQVASSELVGAMEMVTLHEVRAAIPGVVKTIYKNCGDSVKANQDPLLQIQNTRQLRAEALADVQDAQKIKPGMDVMLEVSLPANPLQILAGPLQEINAVAVNNGQRRFVIAASQDRTVRGWDAATWQEMWKLTMPSPARAVACAPKNAERDLLLVGLGDGSAHLYDLSGKDRKPLTLGERHKGPVTCAAFSPDGSLCATSGDDRTIMLWSVADGKRLQRLPDAHRAAITSLAFLEDGRLLSAGRDNALMVWEAKPDKPLALAFAPFDRRSGDVTQLGVHGDRVLFDAGKELRVLSLGSKQNEGVMKTSSAGATFSTMALFSPDGKAVLTVGGVEGRPQLWRSPPRRDADPTKRNALTDGRGSELRNLSWEQPITCGAFDPDGKFAVTGTQDNKVLIWAMPSGDEMDKRLPATISLVDPFVEHSKQVRVWAELKEHPSWVVPGSMTTIVVPPEEANK